MPQLYMIGTMHADFKGPERLRKLLGFIRPSTIFLECDQELFDGICATKDTRKNTLKIEDIFFKLKDLLSQLSAGKRPEEKFDLRFEMEKVVGYEIWATLDYQKEEAPWTKICPAESSELLLEIPMKLPKEPQSLIDLLVAGLKKSATKDTIQKYWDEYYYSNIAELTAQSSKENIAWLQKRDTYFEKKIRELAVADSNAAIIMGCAHLYGEYGNLYDRLKDFSPIRIKLPEADNF